MTFRSGAQTGIRTAFEPSLWKPIRLHPKRLTVCLPDETRLLASPPVAADGRRLTSPAEKDQSLLTSAATVRRLIAARDDSRALYLSTQGLRVGRKDEVLQIKQEQSVLEEVRINDASHVALFGNIQITSRRASPPRSIVPGVRP